MSKIKSKLTRCVTLMVIDDEFNNATSDRMNYINSYINYPIDKLNTDEENIIRDALFKIHTTDLKIKKNFVLHCKVYDEAIAERKPNIFMVKFLILIFICIFKF